MEGGQPTPLGTALNPSLCCWSSDPQCKCCKSAWKPLAEQDLGMAGLALCSFHVHSLLSSCQGCCLPFAFLRAGSVPHPWSCLKEQKVLPGTFTVRESCRASPAWDGSWEFHSIGWSALLSQLQSSLCFFTPFYVPSLEIPVLHEGTNPGQLKASKCNYFPKHFNKLAACSFSRQHFPVTPVCAEMCLGPFSSGMSAQEDPAGQS